MKTDLIQRLDRIAAVIDCASDLDKAAGNGTKSEAGYRASATIREAMAELEKKASRQRVTNAPTLHEVQTYAFDFAPGQQRAGKEAQRFHDYFSSNGWKVGRNPMKDWRAAFRNWLSRSSDFAPANGTAPRKSTADVAREMGVGR